MSPFGRSPFDAEAKVVARRDLKIGERTYKPGQEMASGDRDQLTDRQLATLWQQGAIDTLPREKPATHRR